MKDVGPVRGFDIIIDQLYSFQKTGYKFGFKKQYHI